MKKQWSKHLSYTENSTLSQIKVQIPKALKSDLESWLNDVTVENDEVLEKAREFIDGFPKWKRLLSLPLKPLGKPSSLPTSWISKTSGQRQRELLIAKHRRVEIDRQNTSRLRLVQGKQKLDLQRLKQEEERMKKEQALMLAELEEDKGRRLAEATLTELELTEDVVETSRSLQETLSEVSVHNQSVKSVRLNNWVRNFSTEVKNHLAKLQDSTLETERRGF